jgi:hypothetical protein
MTTITPKVDLTALMLEAAREAKSQTVCYGFSLASVRLRQITQRAIELEDEALLEALVGLGLVQEEPDPTDDVDARTRG